MKRALLAILLLSAVSSFAQIVHRSDIILNKQNKPIAGATIYVCQQPAIGVPCANQVQLYGDLAGSTTKAQPTHSDANGNFDIYAQSGWVTLQVINGYAFPITYQDYGLFVVGGSASTGNDFTFSILTPGAFDSGVSNHKINHNIGVVRVSCDTDQGSVTVDLESRPEGAPHSSGTPVIGGSGLACSPTTGVITLLTNPLVSANRVITPILSSVSGSPGVVNIHVSDVAK